MRNVKRIFFLMVCLILSTALCFAHGEKETENVDEVNAEIEAIKASGGEYAVYEAFREAADNQESYPGLPGAGKEIGFANLYGTLPFCISVEEDIQQQALLAGFGKKSFFLMDNQYDSSIGLKNADIMLSKHPDVFIEYQADAKVNSIVAQKFSNVNIPVLAVDIPVPDAPFMGIDNWNVAYLAGTEMAHQIKIQWGGIDKVDLIVLLQNPIGGEALMQRSEGVASALVDEFGDIANDKIFRVNGGTGQSDQAKSAMDNALAAHPKAVNIVATGLNDQMVAGVIASLQGAGRWNAEDIILVTFGVDELGQTLIRSGQVEAGVAFLPEQYGRYCVPAAAAMMLGEPVPEKIFIQNKVINLDNINDYYPQ